MTECLFLHFAGLTLMLVFLKEPDRHTANLMKRETLQEEGLVLNAGPSSQGGKPDHVKNEQRKGYLRTCRRDVGRTVEEPTAPIIAKGAPWKKVKG